MNRFVCCQSPLRLHPAFRSVEASTHQVADQQMPVYDLPPKILCRFINVQLKAEPDTDEVFAQVTLLPDGNEEPILDTSHNYRSS